MRLIDSLLILALLAVPADAQSAEAEANPQAALSTAIPHALTLIEGKQYEKFIRQYAVPAELKKILKQKTMDELVRGFAKDHAEKITLILNRIGSEKPHFSANGTVAEYPVEIKNFSQKKLVFEKISGRWYLRN